MMSGSSSTKNIKKSLNDELNEGEVNLTKKMREEKAEFIKQFQKHQIKSTDEEFAKALEGEKAPSSISVAKRKRDSDDDVKDLEKQVRLNVLHIIRVVHHQKLLELCDRLQGLRID